ncbi:MAG: CRISPR-associated helicase Cas3', partial [Candidatus Heritagella sp.]
HYFPLFRFDRLDSDFSEEQEKERGTEAWNRLSLPEPWCPPCTSMEPAVFEQRFGFFPNPLQQAVLDISREIQSPGLLIIEAQMGIGKTEAALAAAEVFAAKAECGGLFFGLPTQATANGIFPRLKQWAEKQSEKAALGIRLAHGMAELNEEYRELFHGNSCVEEDDADHGLVVHEWFEGRKQALLADFVIGTIDQFLMASLKQKHGMLRHLGLAGKVVVLDECHAYDCYMNQYLDRTLNWLGVYRVPVILLSATLPARRRQELVDAYLSQKTEEKRPDEGDLSYPVLTWTEGESIYRRSVEIPVPPVSVRLCRLEETQTADYLREKLAQGGCAGVIVNTVSRAQQMAERLAGQLPECQVFLIHSRYTAADRAERETVLLQRLGKNSSSEQRDCFIVVGTQVLEQSLDIDFDAMVTDLCPMDLLLQRMGRLHRHKDRVRPEKLRAPECALLGAAGELEAGSRSVYGGWLLLRTRMLLPETVTLPGDIPILVQSAYRLPEEDDLRSQELREAWELHQETQRKKQNKAQTFLLPPPDECTRSMGNLFDTELDDGELYAKAAVRDTDPSVDVLLMEYDPEEEKARFLPWQYQGQMVSLHTMPSEEECRMILRQQIHLPRIFCVGKNLDRTIRQLEEQRRIAPSWWESRWMRDQLVLWLDHEGRASLCGVTVRYTREKGLEVERKDENENAGI